MTGGPIYNLVNLTLSPRMTIGLQNLTMLVAESNTSFDYLLFKKLMVLSLRIKIESFINLLKFILIFFKFTKINLRVSCVNGLLIENLFE